MSRSVGGAICGTEVARVGRAEVVGTNRYVSAISATGGYVGGIGLGFARGCLTVPLLDFLIER